MNNNNVLAHKSSFDMENLPATNKFLGVSAF